MKKLVFVSNYLSHYSRSISEAFIKIYGKGYIFVAMTEFNKARLAAGFHDMNDESFVLRAYENSEAYSRAMNIINEAECVICGGMPVKILQDRLNSNMLTFMQSERFYKGPVWKDLARFVKYSLYSGGRRAAKDNNAKFYLLCNGAFTAWDYNTCGLFRNKSYKWGYFPELKSYDDVEGLMSRKEKGYILWAGRLLDWKHPELALMLAKNLKSMGKNFRLKVVGSGSLQESLSGIRAAMKLDDCVEISGALPTEQVRKEMERAEIFLFTSDRGEGWGVVLNEAMNSACAVVAANKIGAVPYLLKHERNGLIFKDRDSEDLTRLVVRLLQNPCDITKFGMAAYKTMCDEWNPEVAAKRFVKLAEALRENDGPVKLFDDGPCSVAQ